MFFKSVRNVSKQEEPSKKNQQNDNEKPHRYFLDMYGTCKDKQRRISTVSIAKIVNSSPSD
jgi:hypothetical protein